MNSKEYIYSISYKPFCYINYIIHYIEVEKQR